MTAFSNPANPSDQTLVVFFSRPGGGKGTQIKNLLVQYNASVFGTGEYIRNNLASNPLLAEFFSKSSGATLLPDELIMPPTVEWLTKTPSRKKMLDGLPRNLTQCELFKIAEKLGIRKRTLIHLDVPEPICNERLFKRAQEDPSRRHELEPDVREKRFREFDEFSAPIPSYLREHGLAEVYTIITDGLEPPDRITMQIRSVLGLVGVLPDRIVSPFAEKPILAAA